MSWRKANFFSWVAKQQETDDTEHVREAVEATVEATANKQVLRNAQGKAYASEFVGDLDGNVTGNVEGDLDGTASLAEAISVAMDYQHPLKMGTGATTVWLWSNTETGLPYYKKSATAPTTDTDGHIIGHGADAASATTALDALKGDAKGFFVSEIIDGTGSEIETTHGLKADDGTTDVAPRVVMVSLVKAAHEGDVVTPGTHTTTVCKVTATTGCKYQILALR